MGLAELAEQVSSKTTAPTWPLAAKHATCEGGCDWRNTPDCGYTGTSRSLCCATCK
jgi:hypothetical protein